MVNDTPDGTVTSPVSTTSPDQASLSDSTPDVVGRLLGTMQIATQSDVKKIDRRLSRISKQLKELDASKKSPESQ